MRPPSCEVCDTDLEGSGEQLVSFARLPDSAAKDASHAVAVVEHPEHQGWFCETHREAARALTTTHTLTDAVRAMRERAQASPPESSDERDLPGWEAVVQSLRAVLPRLTAELGLTDIRPIVESEREWTPMDGAEAPWCPYIDRETTIVEGGETVVRLIVERAQWNDDEVARADVVLTIDAPGGSTRVSAARGPGGGALESVRGLEALPADAHQSILDALTPRPAAGVTG